MALERKDRVKDQTTTTGTGTVSIGGVAPTGYRTFTAAHTSGATVRYTIVSADLSEWEVGEGVWTSAGSTLTRVTVYASSNANALVSFSAGTKVVFTGPTAEFSDVAPTLGWYSPSADSIRTPNSVTVDDDMTVTGSNGITISQSVSGAAVPLLTLTNTNADASALELKCDRFSASPAANDELARVYFRGKSSTGVTREFGLVIVTAKTVTNAAEASKLDYYNLIAGTQTLVLSIDGAAVTIPGSLIVSTVARCGAYTVATLPAGTDGDIARVSDQLTTVAAKGVAPTGGGSVHCYVMYNGSAWVGI